MGGSSEMMIEHEQYIKFATSYLVDRGYLQECPYHGMVYDGAAIALDDGVFYPRAMADRKRGTNGPVPWATKLEAREYTDILKEAHEEHAALNCTHCERHEAE